MKPVSQGGRLAGPAGNGGGRKRSVLDPDVHVIKEFFSLDLDEHHMAPLVVGPGYTRSYIDAPSRAEMDQAQVDAVLEGFRHIERRADTMIIEGTGHTGVGSIINMNNGQACALLGADAVLVANGGLGSAFDELELQRVMMERHNVKIRGVVLNKVLPAKLDMVRDYFGTLLERNWGSDVPLVGCIPDHGFLGQPTLEDLEDFFGGVLLTGHRDRRGHYPLERCHLIVTDLRRFMTQLEEDNQSRTLYVTHCSRDDIILGFVSHCQRMRHRGRGNFEAALLICGHHTEDFYPAIEEAASAADYPIMHVPLTTHATLLALRAFVPKLNTRDTVRTEALVDHYEPFIDFDKLMPPLGAP